MKRRLPPAIPGEAASFFLHTRMLLRMGICEDDESSKMRR